MFVRLIVVFTKIRRYLNSLRKEQEIDEQFLLIPQISLLSMLKFLKHPIKDETIK